MRTIGAAVLLAAGLVIGWLMVKNIRRFVVEARKGDEHANGMVMTYVFTGIIISIAVMIIVSLIFGCSQLWYFPTFAVSFIVNMMRQYRDEKGSMEMPPVNQEFIDHFKADAEKYAAENAAKKAKKNAD